MTKEEAEKLIKQYQDQLNLINKQYEEINRQNQEQRGHIDEMTSKLNELNKNYKQKEDDVNGINGKIMSAEDRAKTLQAMLAMKNQLNSDRGKYETDEKIDGIAWIGAGSFGEAGKDNRVDFTRVIKHKTDNDRRNFKLKNLLSGGK